MGETKRASQNSGFIDRNGGKPGHDSRSPKEKQRAPEKRQSLASVSGRTGAGKMGGEPHIIFSVHDHNDEMGKAHSDSYGNVGTLYVTPYRLGL